MTTAIDTPQPDQQPEPSYARSIIIWILVAMLITAGYLLWRKSQGFTILGAQELHGFVIESPAPLINITLTSHNGESVSFADFRGQVVVVYFGYTHCPDVCPMTLAQVQRAKAALPERLQEKVQVLMISVDPERDTPELLKSYLGHFDPTFLGMTGSIDEIEAAAAPLGIYYERRDFLDSASYFVDHTATVAILDKDGKLRLVWPYGLTAEEMTPDLTYFIRE